MRPEFPLPHARRRPHVPMRPLFRCRGCGARWPCSTARLALLFRYRDDPEGLRRYLGEKLLSALTDQPDVAPLALATRFLGWLPGARET
ncbi:3CxxC-type zinc finger protein [Plantactinospora sp. WMMC1484]|uniref:3CxxC-type zinc finger protein n=1 Tax=Plantactinospora sp. WMMC1484 TaxID=3404122 RepID=UPI003BF5CF59